MKVIKTVTLVGVGKQQRAVALLVINIYNKLKNTNFLYNVCRMKKASYIYM